MPKEITIYIGADYRAYDLKSQLIPYLTSCHDFIKIVDCGCKASDEQNDYNDYAIEVSRKVKTTIDSFGILICSSAHGMTIQANRFKGIRACYCPLEESAKLAREHENSNVLCLSSELTDLDVTKKIIYAYFHTKYEPTARRERRIERLDEEEYD